MEPSRMGSSFSFFMKRNAAEIFQNPSSYEYFVDLEGNMFELHVYLSVVFILCGSWIDLSSVVYVMIFFCLRCLFIYHGLLFFSLTLTSLLPHGICWFMNHFRSKYGKDINT